MLVCASFHNNLIFDPKKALKFLKKKEAQVQARLFKPASKNGHVLKSQDCVIITTCSDRDTNVWSYSRCTT